MRYSQYFTPSNLPVTKAECLILKRTKPEVGAMEEILETCEPEVLLAISRLGASGFRRGHFPNSLES